MDASDIDKTNSEKLSQKQASGKQKTPKNDKSANAQKSQKTHGDKPGTVTAVKLPALRKKPAETVSRCPDEDGDTPDMNYQSPLQAVDPQAGNQWTGHTPHYHPMMAMHGMSMPQMAQMPFYPPMFPPFQWANNGNYEADPHDPETDSEDIHSEDSDEEGDENEPSETVEVSSKKQSLIKSGLLSAHVNRNLDDVTDDTHPEAAALGNNIWTSKFDKDEIKDIFKQAKRPENTIMRKVDINEEVLPSINQVAKTKDIRLRAIQGATAKAFIPSMEIVAEMIREDKPVERQKIVNLAVVSMKLLSHANQQLNQLRRDLLRPTMQPRFQQLCSKPDDDSRLLFGTKIADRIKNAAQGGKLAKRGRGRGNARHHPYPFPTYPTYGGYSAYGQHYSRGATKGPFLGRKKSSRGRGSKSHQS